MTGKFEFVVLPVSEAGGIGAGERHLMHIACGKPVIPRRNPATDTLEFLCSDCGFMISVSQDDALIAAIDRLAIVQYGDEIVNHMLSSGRLIQIKLKATQLESTSK